VKGYRTSTWVGSPPAFNTTPPASPIATISTNTSFGDHGAWELSVPDNEAYFVVVEYLGDYYWKRYNIAVFVDGGAGAINVSTGVINGASAWGLSPDATHAYIKPVNTSNSGSISGGSVNLGAFIDHQHAGLGLSQDLIPGHIPTRYVGGTSGTPPDDPTTFADGDFAIDSSGIVWIYNYSGNIWNPVISNASQYLAGAITAFGGVVLPTGWLKCDGSTQSRTTFAALWKTLSTEQFVGTANAFVGSTTAGSATVSGIPTAITDILQPGWPIEGSPIFANSTISSVSSGSIVLSHAATATATGALVAAPWGLGNGTSTFNLPDLRGRTAVGTGALNTVAQPTLSIGSSTYSVPSLSNVGGEAQHTLILAEAPNHNHSFSDPGHSHGTPDGHQDVPDSATAGLWTNQSVYDYLPGTTVNYTGITFAAQGGGLSHNNMQPFGGVMYIIKT